MRRHDSGHDAVACERSGTVTSTYRDICRSGTVSGWSDLGGRCERGAFDTAYDAVTVNSADGTAYTVEVIPEDLVYFVSAGTGTGYFNKNTQAAVSEPFQAIAALEEGLKNDASDAAYTEASGWGHVYDSSTYKVSATVDNGDRPNSYTSTDKYTVGLRDKTGGEAPMTYRFTLEAGVYELTTGYHEFYGANRTRDMQPKVTWTDFTGEQQSVEGDLIQLRSADQTGTISFQIDSPGVVSYELSKVSGEASDVQLDRCAKDGGCGYRGRL